MCRNYSDVYISLLSIRLSLSHPTFHFLFPMFGFPWFENHGHHKITIRHRRSRYTTQCFRRTQSTGRGTIEINYECVPYHQDRTAETVGSSTAVPYLKWPNQHHETKRTKPICPTLALHSRSRSKEANYFFGWSCAV